MCDYWTGNVVSTDDRVEADSCVPYHDILYYRYPALGILDGPLQGKNASEGYGLEVEGLFTPHECKDLQRVQYVPDLDKVDSSALWSVTDPWVYNDSASALYLFGNEYIDGVDTGTEDESLQSMSKRTLHSVRNSDGVECPQIEVDEDRRSFQGYHLLEQDALLYDRATALYRRFPGGRRSSVLGSFAFENYTPGLCPAPQICVASDVASGEGVSPNTDQEYSVDQRSRLLIHSPVRRDRLHPGNPDPDSEGEPCSHASESESPSSAVGAVSNNRKFRKSRNSLVGFGSHSPLPQTRARGKKSHKGVRSQSTPNMSNNMPPSNSAHGETSAVITTEYCKVRVYEVTCNNVPVMLRKLDSYVNATQILKAAGIEKGKRIRILDREVARSDHEKVQGGCGKYQGTWVPFEKGLHLASTYGIDRELRPLFDLQRSSSIGNSLNNMNNDP